jgi:hypothetical protein
VTSGGEAERDVPGHAEELQSLCRDINIHQAGEIPTVKMSSPVDLSPAADDLAPKLGNDAGEPEGFLRLWPCRRDQGGSPHTCVVEKKAASADSRYAWRRGKGEGRSAMPRGRT